MARIAKGVARTSKLPCLLAFFVARTDGPNGALLARSGRGRLHLRWAGRAAAWPRPAWWELEIAGEHLGEEFALAGEVGLVHDSYRDRSGIGRKAPSRRDTIGSHDEGDNLRPYLALDELSGGSRTSREASVSVHPDGVIIKSSARP